MSEEIALTLLQFVALSLPAIAIYMDISLPDPSETTTYHDGEAANYQNLRLSVLQLLGAAAMLLIYLFVWQHLSVLYVAAFSIFLGIGTFGLAVLFDDNLLFSHHSILWGYKNTYHRLRDSVFGPREP